MVKRILLTIMLLLCIDCLTVGKVGYIVPAEKDAAEIPATQEGEYCAVVVIDMLDNLNNELKAKNVTSLKDVTLVFKQGFLSKNCLQAKK